MEKYNRFVNNQVEAKFVAYPKTIRLKLLFLRELIFDTAAGIQGVGEIEETLKWGEPSLAMSPHNLKAAAPSELTGNNHHQTIIISSLIVRRH